MKVGCVSSIRPGTPSDTVSGLWKHHMNMSWTPLALWAAPGGTDRDRYVAGLRRTAGRGPRERDGDCGRADPKGPYRTRQGSREMSIDLPEHCRVAALLTPSEIPTSKWSSGFLSTGTASSWRSAMAGWAGSISYRALAAGLKEGLCNRIERYGHQDRGASFVMGHPEKLIDFAHRAMQRDDWCKPRSSSGRFIKRRFGSRTTRGALPADGRA